MSSKQKPDELHRVAIEDRHAPSRDDSDAADWETIVLRRMADRVNSLSGGPDSLADPSRDHGWEQAALLALRRRVRQLKPE
jgi:hypothetical protein